MSRTKTQALTKKQNGSAPDPSMQARYHSLVDEMCKHFGSRLQMIVLFGSQARNDARPDSDHDLFVIINELPKDPVARQRIVRGMLLPILTELPGRITLIAKTPEEVAANLTPLLLDICIDGICLWGADVFESYRRKALAALDRSPLHRQWIGGTFMWVSPQTPPREWELNWEGYVEHA